MKHLKHSIDTASALTAVLPVRQAAPRSAAGVWALRNWRKASWLLLTALITAVHSASSRVSIEIPSEVARRWRLKMESIHAQFVIFWKIQVHGCIYVGVNNWAYVRDTLTQGLRRPDRQRRTNLERCMQVSIARWGQARQARSWRKLWVKQTWLQRCVVYSFSFLNHVVRKPVKYARLRGLQVWELTWCFDSDMHASYSIIQCMRSVCARSWCT